MLRSIKSKIGGLILVLVFLFLLWIPTNNQSCCYSVVRQVVFWVIVVQLVLLRYLGACAPEAPYVLVSQVRSCLVISCLLAYKGLWSY